MVVSHAHRFAFIHIPKTGGVSVATALFPFATRVRGFWLNRICHALGFRGNLWAPYEQKWFRVHTTAQVLQRELPGSVFDGLFKFAFVRNPWDMLISRYHYIRKSKKHHRHRLVSTLSFDEFVEYEGRGNKRLQSRFVVDRQGHMLVDFVGRFESLKADFAQACDRIGIAAELPHLNPSKHCDFRSYYTDRLERRVAELMAEDVERFGYTYEDSTTSKQPHANAA